LNVAPHAGGYGIDTNVGGFDTKPTLEQVTKAAQASDISDKGAKILPMEY
jgi:hypothetical protein